MSGPRAINTCIGEKILNAKKLFSLTDRHKKSQVLDIEAKQIPTGNKGYFLTINTAKC